MDNLSSRSGVPSGATVAHVRYDSRDLDDAYDRWRDEHPSLSLAYAITPGPTPFRLEATGVAFSNSSVTRFDLSGMTYARDDARIAADQDDGLIVQLTEAGGLTGSTGDTELTVPGETAVFIDRTLPLLNRSVDSRGMIIRLPREALAGADGRTLHGKVISGGAFTLLRDYSARLMGAPERMLPGAAERTEEALGRVLSATFQRDPHAALAADEAVGALQVERIRRYIERHALTGPIDTQKVVAASGASRSTVYRLTAPLGGLHNLVWTARCEAARTAMLDPRHPGRLADIASEFGFTSQAHFSRRFKEAYGFSPRDLRPF